MENFAKKRSTSEVNDSKINTSNNPNQSIQKNVIHLLSYLVFSIDLSTPFKLVTRINKVILLHKISNIYNQKIVRSENLLI